MVIKLSFYVNDCQKLIINFSSIHLPEHSFSFFFLFFSELNEKSILLETVEISHWNLEKYVWKRHEKKIWEEAQKYSARIWQRGFIYREWLIFVLQIFVSDVRWVYRVHELFKGSWQIQSYSSDILKTFASITASIKSRNFPYFWMLPIAEKLQKRSGEIFDRVKSHTKLTKRKIVRNSSSRWCNYELNNFDIFFTRFSKAPLICVLTLWRISLSDSKSSWRRRILS